MADPAPGIRPWDRPPVGRARAEQPAPCLGLGRGGRPAGPVPLAAPRCRERSQGSWTEGAGSGGDDSVIPVPPRSCPSPSPTPPPSRLHHPGTAVIPPPPSLHLRHPAASALPAPPRSCLQHPDTSAIPAPPQPDTAWGSFSQESPAPGVCRGRGAICRSSEPRKAIGPRHHRVRHSEPPASPTSPLPALSAPRRDGHHRHLRQWGGRWGVGVGSRWAGEGEQAGGRCGGQRAVPSLSHRLHRPRPPSSPATPGLARRLHIPRGHPQGAPSPQTRVSAPKHPWHPQQSPSASPLPAAAPSPHGSCSPPPALRQPRRILRPASPAASGPTGEWVRGVPRAGTHRAPRCPPRRAGGA